VGDSVGEKVGSLLGSSVGAYVGAAVGLAAAMQHIRQSSVMRITAANCHGAGGLTFRPRRAINSGFHQQQWISPAL
jgi:hypothetical protein